MNATDIVAIVTAVAAALTVGISLFSLQNARDSLRTARAAATLASRHGTKVFDGDAMSGLTLSGLAYPRRIS
jgi:hypothetical protein